MTEGRAGHVVLVGLMGSGKSTLGRSLAQRLGRSFFDADLVLEEVAGRTIGEIFAVDGEATFRALEHDVLARLLAAEQPAVIASGGGVVVLGENRRLLGAASVTVVWLDGDPSFLASRVAGTGQRPLLLGDDAPGKVLARLHAERGPWYAEVADITVGIGPQESGARSAGALAERVTGLVLAHEARVSA